MLKQRVLLPFLAVFLVSGAGCGGGETLDYDTALNLARDRNTQSVDIKFSSAPPRGSMDAPGVQAYHTLSENHVLECKDAEQLGTICSPGPAGTLIQQSGPSELSMSAGHWTPAAIQSIQRTGRESATAQVRLAFEPTSLYREFEQAFDAILLPGSAIAVAGKKDAKLMTATYQHYEDGWHLENLQ